MEKYGQYRDRGSGIAPFFTIASPPSSALLLPYHAFLFFLRLPFLAFACFVWLAVVQWTAAGNLLRKANLWCILGIPGVWWIDIRVDGVQRGSLAKSGRLPGPGDIIASSSTSPLDVLYLAAIFDPIFTQSYAAHRAVQPLSLPGALAACFALPSNTPTNTLPLAHLAAQNPHRIIVVFPEGTTSNGRGILTLSPSLLSAPPRAQIFPVSMRYSPADVVTPIPGLAEAGKFFWKLCSRQTHTIRVRVGMPVNLARQQREMEMEVEARGRRREKEKEKEKERTNGYDTNFFDSLTAAGGELQEEGVEEVVRDDVLSEAETRALDTVAEALGRLGRAKTLGLGIEEKRRFVHAWMGREKGGKKRR